jgi:hypothetical protein
MVHKVHQQDSSGLYSLYSSELVGHRSMVLHVHGGSGSSRAAVHVVCGCGIVGMWVFAIQQFKGCLLLGVDCLVLIS